MERWAERAPVKPQALRTLDDMPGPSVASFAWDLFARRGLSRLHELQLEGVQRYGPMWKASFGPILTVHVADPALIEQVLRQEGQHPMRSDLSSWKDYRKLRGHNYGLLTSVDWSYFQKSLRYCFISRCILRLRYISVSPCAVLSHFCIYTFFCSLTGISSVLFESRIGSLDEVVPEETERFIQSINTMFVMTLLTMAMPKWLHQLFPKPWNIFCQCWDYMFEFAKGHIDQRLTAEAEKVARGEEVEGRYLTYFLSRTGLPMKTVYSNITELLLAGVDTISSTMSWSLYELSRHPEGRSIPEAKDVACMPLLKATVKEVLRLYPVIPANARVITERDIQVGGYLIPKNTLITLCHFATSRDPAVFSNPDEFQPHRWLNKDQAHHPYASVPFGVGKRSCIGRRIAELELYLALSRILIEFDVKPDPEGISVKPMTRTLLVPENVISLQFIER
uniref:Cytochrome P450, family 27, subfamily B, polypeptide 1 n=1 Tax=Cyclopterus lumpus TaxID=8103 RepID=A0A8C2WQ48_CYCLU